MPGTNTRGAETTGPEERAGDGGDFDAVQLSRLLSALQAMRDGNFRRRLPVSGDGLPAELAIVYNEIADRQQHLLSELTRVQRVVGREGRHSERLHQGLGEGGWARCAEAANSIVTDLVRPTGEFARVVAAVSEGDLTQRMDLKLDGRRLRGEPLRVARSVNGLVDQLSSIADEITRVTREVGTEGKLGGQAKVRAADGSWRDLIDAVNTMSSRLTDQVRDIALVTTAVADGDLTRSVTVEVAGEMAQLKATVDRMVAQLSSFASEVTRVAREVGTEGRLGGQADVRGVSGTWKDLTDSVNIMASNLTSQVRGISSVAQAVARGDLSQQITVTARGEVAELADTLNSMTATLQTFADEVTRVAREVGTEGILGGQADVPGVAGRWKDLTESVNYMADNLTAQVRDIAQVTTAVARGDLSQKITVDVKGELAQLKTTVNVMVDQLSSFADQVTRVAREVGSEGILGGQADVPGVAGTWKDLTDSVNSMASNLTNQVRNIAQVTTAVARGDLSQKITVDVRGELAELKNTVNTMVDQLSSFADEVTRVAREVGGEGRLGGQAAVPGVSGTWRDLTDSVNFMAGTLTAQVRNIAEVTTAVARGDLTRTITVEARGEILELKNTVNTMVDQLSSFADEVTRVAREVGTEGRLGGQADVHDVSGTWKDLTENVNMMAANLTSQVRNIAEVTTAVASGDLTRKITVDARGEILELKSTVNTMVDQLSSFADEVTRVAREVGTEGMLGGQARVPGVAGTWRDLTVSVNSMASNLTNQVRNIAAVSTAVARGDLSQKISIEARGEVAALASTINAMVDTLRAFADEVTRVAREVGTEGILGGQAHVRGVAGTWKDLTDSVNSMAGNLTSQVRSIALVTTAVAHGDLTQKTYVDARGEILELKTTVNRMVDQLSSFADEVTRVAREVGTEGKLGGQAEVADVSGTWRKLTENVNQLAGTLTTQLRAIAEVSTAVTQGDLSQQITVEAEGEVAELKDNLNQMIDNLRETTRANQEQDWLKTNLARFTGHMQGGRDLLDVTQLIVNELTPLVGARQGSFFLTENGHDGIERLRRIASYGYRPRKDVPDTFGFGEGLVGQSALERAPILVTDVPPAYLHIGSGLGQASPLTIIILPVVFEERVLGVVELASFRPFSVVHRQFLEQLMEIIGVSLNAIIASSRTKALLVESQRLAAELQSKSGELQTQQRELQQSNAELEEKASLLAKQNRAIEIKNLEIEEARRALEDRAEQLSLSSRYKSEFLANMSHELRTPLNSLLILAKLLADNPDGNLNHRQVEFAQTIHSAGTDLLQLINDILDLSKVEAGKMDVHPADVAVSGIVEYVEATFRPLTAEKDLRFSVWVSEDVPRTLVSDQHRLQQVLRNLLSNAVKFTSAGEVTLSIRSSSDEHFSTPQLTVADQVLAFEVTDTGIGIPVEQLRTIFEAFQQADGTISRKFGGTGLGLSISREIARLIGGEIHVESQPGRGSKFTLYVPTRLDTGTKPVLATPDDVGARPSPSALSPAVVAADLPPEPVEDDAADIAPGDRVLLVALNDAELCRSAMAVGRAHGFKVLATVHADRAVVAARERRPDGMVVGMDMVTHDGTSLVHWLKRLDETRQVPVVATHPAGAAETVHAGWVAGALDVVEVPFIRAQLDAALERLELFIERSKRSLLVVTADAGSDAAAVAERFERVDEVEVEVVGTPEEAVSAFNERSYDCVLVDFGLPDAGGLEVLKRVRARRTMRHTPLVVSGSTGLAEPDQARLAQYAEALTVTSPPTLAALVEQTAVFLHRSDVAPAAEPDVEAEQQAVEGRRILIVDDDVRNVFALASALEQHGIDVLYAENGEEGLQTLRREPDIDLVLMDVMMPGMDGYTAMREIRMMPTFRDLPVIALTAKAMPGDRDNSLTAGASDYVTKPVDVEQLLSVIRSWLS
ncbi:HAMP domain-containing protein [Oryzihumus leptocrescens]|uniref:Circadian input-output histidine kinase CikA n=1 Tax=Oryzihumus leptocrescens TaxID=297536 RepID=A0A542ZIX7_9MICO|nr:HAMP domain-containing protein [Oryzihumus leptocrescens]TQL60302.1 signal transduction histidine kinase [Oryzihumus leptocrescens]